MPHYLDLASNVTQFCQIFERFSCSVAIAISGFISDRPFGIIDLNYLETTGENCAWQQFHPAGHIRREIGKTVL